MRLNRTRRCDPRRVAPPTRWRTGLAAIVLLGAVTAGCGSSGSGSSSSSAGVGAATPASSSATLRVGDQAGTGAQALLSAAGLLDKLPFKVAWSDFTSGPPMLQAMSSGALDIGGVGDAPPVFAAAGGAKIALVGALATNPNNAALVVSRQSPIQSINQLRGKKIAVAQGSSADYHLLTVLSKAGLGVHDVTLEYLQPAQALAALASGSVDAWDTWAPFIQQATAQESARIVVNGAGYGSNYSYEVAPRNAIGDPAKANEIREYLKLLDQAHRWANVHPRAWANVWAKATGLPVAVMATAAKDDTAKPVPIDRSIVSAEQALVNGFSKAGLIPTQYDFSKYAYEGFNQTVGAGS